MGYAIKMQILKMQCNLWTKNKMKMPKIIKDANFIPSELWNAKNENENKNKNGKFNIKIPFYMKNMKMQQIKQNYDFKSKNAILTWRAWFLNESDKNKRKLRTLSSNAIFFMKKMIFKY